MPVTTRANGRSPIPQTPTTQAKSEEPIMMSPVMQSSKPSPYLLLAYPLILAVGSLYSTINFGSASHNTSSPFAPGAASDLNPPTAPTSYFAHKSNLVNQYFVKIGWFWTTLAFILLQATTRPKKTSSSSQIPSHYMQSAIRYALVTVAWILTTQWFLGPALIDRSFTITGGHCEAHPAKLDREPLAIDVTRIAAGPVCKAAGGRWRGGHDISGHVFMLVLASAFLLFELYLSDRHSTHPHVSAQAAARVAAETSEEEKKAMGGWEDATTAKVRLYSRYFVWAVVALDLWMLMMTAIWFHTWLEKLSGFMIADACIWAVYFLPDFVPAWREVVGGL